MRKDLLNDEEQLKILEDMYRIDTGNQLLIDRQSRHCL